MKPSRYHTVYAGNEVVEQRELTYDWVELRILRDEMLEKSDWRFNSDIPVNEEWASYRQALRDLPANFPDPIDAVENWPDEPEEA